MKTIQLVVCAVGLVLNCCPEVFSFSEDFESFTLGALDGQNGWTGSPEAQIVDSGIATFDQRSLQIRSSSGGSVTTPKFGAGYGRLAFDVRIDSAAVDVEYAVTTLINGGTSSALQFFPNGQFTMTRSVGTCLRNEFFVNGTWTPDTTHRLEWIFDQRRAGRENVDMTIRLDDQLIYEGGNILGCNAPDGVDSFQLDVSPAQDPFVTIDNLEFERFLPSADLDGDGTLDVDDLDLLSSVVRFDPNFGPSSPMFDLNADGNFDQVDIDFWLAVAGAENLPNGTPYLRGDANLDGFVDAADFVIWNDNKFQTYTGFWSGGDFNADAATDAEDFLIWNNNKFNSSLVIAVPEPLLGYLGWVGTVALLMRRRAI